MERAVRTVADQTTAHAAVPAGPGQGQGTAEQVADTVRRHPMVERVTRWGWLSKGVVYSLMGAVAITVARSEPSDEDASPEGSLSLFSACFYGVLTWTAVRAVWSGDDPDRSTGVERWSANLLGSTDLASATPAERLAIDVTGLTGHLGRAIVVAAVGAFVVSAAITADPEDARGLDRALRHLAGSGWGSAVVLAAAIGLILYGAFCLVSLRYRRLRP